MGVINTVKRWINMFFERDIKEQFGVVDVTSQIMLVNITKCANIYQGRPPWLSEGDNIRTVNFAKVVASETARLTTLAIGVAFDKGARGQWLSSQFERMYFKFRHWAEYGIAFGTVILKPNGSGVDAYLPGQFAITSTNAAGEIDGAVFRDTYEDGGYSYTRLEYQRFVGEQYVITNKAFKSANDNSKGKAVALTETKWGDLLDEVAIENIEKPLFGVYRTPEANNIEFDSPLGMPQFKECIEELRGLDIAYSKNVEEIEDSGKIVFISDSMTMKAGQNLRGQRKGLTLPRFVTNLFGTATETFYKETTPSLNPEQRIQGINNQLDFISYKSGYSPGYFRFDGRTGMVTATQVEADDRRTIQTIKDYRDKLEHCLDGLIYALSKFADLYNLSPAMEYEVAYSFGDITYSYEEDKASWWKYRLQGDIPPWMYFVKFEGMSEDEAKETVEAAMVKPPDLFEEE